MLNKPLKPCGHPRCPELTTEARCPEHTKQQERVRGSAHSRGYNYKWQQYSKRFLKRNPLCTCVECAKLPAPLLAEVTDHIVPHKGDMALFWDKDNHQPLAKACHDKKTATEDGGFGR